MLKAFLLAAGVGSRLQPLTNSIPKCLLPFAGRPLLDYWLELLAEAGCAEARVNTHAHAEQMRKFINGSFPPGYPALSEFFEPKLLGSAGTLAANPSFADGATEIVIIYADQLSNVDLNEMRAFHRSHGDPFSMLLYRVPNPHECGIVSLDDEGRITEFVEKPAEPKSDLANGGVYILSPAAYREIAAAGAFDLGFDVLPQFVGRMRGWIWNGPHRDIGTHAALAKAVGEIPRVKASVAARQPARPAVFLDRDGTLIEAVHYLNAPEQVRLVSDAVQSLQELRLAGFQLVVVTNQSAIGRGLLTEERLVDIHQELIDQLAREGAWLDAIYHCPIAPVESDRSIVEHPDRKPGPGMLLRAAAELNLELSRSWMIGDMISDVLAGENAGCRGSILIGNNGDESTATCRHEVASLQAAADLIISDHADAALVQQNLQPCLEAKR